jgi:DNA-binding MarR family transcriptional regulator
MKNLDYFEKRAEIGAALWLLMMYWAASDPDSWPWQRVMAGEPVADDEAAALLKVSVHTAVRWRKRLVRAGLVETKPSGQGFCIRVQVPAFAMNVGRTFGAHLPPREEWPKMQTEFVQ